ncbi:MAG: ABC transporter ATP-binding protein [Bacillota bacterium]
MAKNDGNSKVLLDVRNLKKYFDTPKGSLRAVDNVTFQIREGRTLGVVGESGCGKSTTGRAILRLHEPTAGEVTFDGIDVVRADKRQMQELRAQMQIIFQDPYASLNPRMSVSQIIAEPMIIHGMHKDKAVLGNRVLDLMETVGLAERLYNAYPHELDGGRRQRIGIARALALNPKFIVCDEPVSALDVSIQAQILNLMQDLQAQMGLTYMFITHDLSVVRHISDEIAVMYLGQLIEKAPSKELFIRPIHPYTQALLSSIPLAKVGARKQRIVLEGEISSPIDPQPGCRFAKRCRFAQPRCREADPELRELVPGRHVACYRAEEFL